MSIGTTLSGTGHAALVVWMVVGWGMSSDPPPFEVMDVSVVSVSEFAALTQGIQPDLPPSELAVIETPLVDQTPSILVERTPPEIAELPRLVVPPAVETPPEAPDLTAPETGVTGIGPEIPDTPLITTPAPSAELGSSTRPIPRAAPRVAPEIVAPPEPDATVAPEVVQAATEEIKVPIEKIVETAEETTAPEAASDQIVTEAEESTFAPEISSRPQTRPQLASAVVETPNESPVNPVAAALAAAGVVEIPSPTQTPTATPGLSGGRLSDGDKSGFLRQIGNCWNVGSTSTGALNTVVEMSFSMTPDGKPVQSSFDLLNFIGGNSNDAITAYKAARRAIIRCTGDAGYDLPRDQYAQWRSVILT
ncbi:MAG: hypothetical protein ACI9RO_001724, partial [Alteromonas macleodii]